MRVLILLLFFSNITLAKDSTFAVKNYLQALKDKDSSKLNSFLSENFINQLGGSDKVVALFSKNEIFVPEKYELSFKESHRKNIFFVNLKYQEHKKKHSSWFKVIKIKDDQFVIDSIVQDME